MRPLASNPSPGLAPWKRQLHGDMVSEEEEEEEEEGIRRRRRRRKEKKMVVVVVMMKKIKKKKTFRLIFIDLQNVGVISAAPCICIY